MRYVLCETVTERREEPLGDVLFSGDLASAVCHESGSSPGGLILENLVARCDEDEMFEDWLLRQVREILILHLRTDEWQGSDGAWLGTRTRCYIEGVVFSAEDRQWLLDRYGRHPEVLAIWRQATCREDERFAA